MSLPNFEAVQWRNSGLMPRLGLGFTHLDARIFFFFLIYILHFSYATLYISLSAVCLFVVLEHYGFGLVVAARRIRMTISGKNRVVNNKLIRRRRFRDV